MNKEPWFYFPNPQDKSLPEEESHHAARVLRKRAGDLVTGFDGRGNVYGLKIKSVGPKTCEVEILEENTFPPPYSHSLTIAIAPPKTKERLGFMVEKLTEIGVNKIQFLLSERSERQSVNMERVLRTMISAAKQCGSHFLPETPDPEDFTSWYSDVTDSQKFICHLPEQATPDSLEEMFKKDEDTCIAIGPEGDFSKNEIAMARSAGFVSAGLGPQVLRTETAALVACTIARSKSF